MIHPNYLYTDKNGVEWVTLGAAWQNPDGTITVEMNVYVSTIEKVLFRPNKFKKNVRQPDFYAKVKTSQFNEEEGEFLWESK